MPHFVIHCSENILGIIAPAKLMQCVYDTAEDSRLFTDGDIKVRLQPFLLYNIGEKESFLHVFAYIMQGRDTLQKGMLSRSMIAALLKLLPDVPILSMNIMDFEKATYCNRSMI